MSYVFPKRELGPQDVLDPEDMNADLMPAVDLLGGRINEHNLKAGLCTRSDPTHTGPVVQLADGALQTPYYVARQVNPGFLSPAADPSHAVPSYTGGGGAHFSDAWPIPPDHQWHQVGENDAAGNQMILTFDTGTGKLWINAMLQFFWRPDREFIGREASSAEWVAAFDSDGDLTLGIRSAEGAIREELGGGPWSGGYTANVRFGIRVDGRVIQETVTGRLDKSPRESSFIPETSVFAEKAFEPQGGDSHSVAPAAIGIRLGCVVDVGPGTHKVELVARTVKRGSVASGSTGITHPDLDRALEPVFSVYNSQLLAVDIPEEPSTSAAPDVPKIESLKSEDKLSNQSMFTDRVQKIKNAYNSVETDSFARGALNQAHLPSPVLFARSSHNRDEVVLFNKWPGYSARSTVFSDLYTMPGPGGEAHTSIQSSSTYFKSILNCPMYNTPPTATPHTYEESYGDRTNANIHAQKCFLVVMADVEVENINTSRDHSLDVMLGLGLGLNLVDSVTRDPIQPGRLFIPEISWAMYNNTNFDNGSHSRNLWSRTYDRMDRFNASVMLVLDMTQRISEARGLFGKGDATQPFQHKTTGDPIQIANVHLLGGVFPVSSDDMHTPPSYGGPFRASVQVRNRNMSVMLMRY
jgi:hypothetical protein